MQSGKRIIIINWRWRVFKGGVNATVLDERNYQNQPEAIEKDKGHYYQEYSVEQDKDALVVALDIYKDNDATDALLKAVLSRYLLPENEVLLFFHRGHFFKDADLGALKSELGNRGKYFLMADGRDYIYYYTHKGGLLDDNGSFYAQEDDDLGVYVETYNKDSGKVVQQYFNRVWQFYQFAFQQKVFELKEALCVVLMPFLMPNKSDVIQVGELKHVIETEKNLLRFRLENFIGIKPVNTTKLTDPRTKAYHESRDKLERLEKDLGKSYFFDDLLANIHASPEYENFMANAYKEVCDDLNEVIFNPKQETTDKATLRKLITHFNELISRIPGELSV